MTSVDEYKTWSKKYETCSDADDSIKFSKCCLVKFNLQSGIVKKVNSYKTYKYFVAYVVCMLMVTIAMMTQ